jgi:cell pole-organizing protein PopZ
MEEILASIRKMISDDRPGPSPMPDQMGRTPFGESRTGAPVDSKTQPRQAAAGPSPQGEAGASNFNSLADALKVATALSDQRRSLQQEIASVLEKGPQRGDPLPIAPKADAQSLPGAGAKPTVDSGARLPNFPDWRAEQAAAQTDAKRELMSFDFGTVVPQREGASAKIPAAEAKPAAEPVAPRVDADKLEGKVEPVAEESRVLPLRAGLIGSAHGLNGAAAPNVAAFPRSLREPAKPAADAIAPTVEKTPETPAKIETPAPAPAGPATSVTAAETTSPSEAASAHTEALLDAVVDMVQQQPETLSVFTSGASFIGGIGAKKVVADAIASASAATSVSADKADASSVPGAPPKLDRAAAELLRPMLRQWLADNMPRIVEEALRSELTDTQGDGKDPAKS